MLKVHLYLLLSYLTCRSDPTLQWKSCALEVWFLSILYCFETAGQLYWSKVKRHHVDPYDIALLWFCAVPKLISPIIRSATVFIFLSSYEHEGSPSVWDKICTNIAAETLRLAVSETNLRKALCIYDEDSMRNLIKKEKDSLSLEFMRRCKFWQAKAL